MYTNAVWTRSTDLSRPIFRPLQALVCFYMIFWYRKQENRQVFQSTHFNKKSPRNLLRLKLEMVNTMNFGLILDMLQG